MLGEHESRLAPRADKEMQKESEAAEGRITVNSPTRCCQKGHLGLQNCCWWWRGEGVGGGEECWVPEPRGEMLQEHLASPGHDVGCGSTLFSTVKARVTGDMLP